MCLSRFLTEELKFNRLKSDPCVYTSGSGDDQLIISVYVDDILIFCRQRSNIDQFKRRFNRKFEIEDISECRKITGIEVERQEDRIHIHQRGYIAELLDIYRMKDSKSERTPLNASLELCCDMSNCDNCALANEGNYRALIGRLLY